MRKLADIQVDAPPITITMPALSYGRLLSILYRLAHYEEDYDDRKQAEAFHEAFGGVSIEIVAAPSLVSGENANPA